MGINNQLTHRYADKMAEMQVLGCLVKDPMLFSDNKYKFNIEDFSDQFHRILFGAIENIAINGAQSISYIDIDQFLKAYPTQYKVFSDNQGPDYILNMLELVDEKNRDYYYKRMKKMSVLNDFSNRGFDVSPIYDDQILDPVKLSEKQRAFDKMSVEDVILYFETQLTQVKEKFAMSGDMEQGTAGDGALELIDKLKEVPEMGLPFTSPKLTTIYRGMILGKLCIESSAQGVGKALPNTSKIPTPNGWKTIGEIKVGDYLFDAQGKPTKVLGVYPQGKKDVYQITFNDGRTSRCCKDHLWSYNNNSQKQEVISQRKFYTNTLEEIIQKGLFTGKKGRQKLKILIPQQKAVEYPEKKHFLPPYIMGLFLGDGSFRESQTNKSLDFSTATPELINVISNTMGWIPKKNSNYNYTWHFGYPGIDHSRTHGNEKMNVWISDALKEHPELINTDSKTKFIPRNYLEDSIEHRWDLLNGLLDTDGSIDKNGKGKISYFTVSPFLRDGFVELARSLGFRTSVAEDHHKSTGVCYIIRLTGSIELKSKLFKLTSKRQRLEKWLNSSTTKKNYISNPIVKIENLGYQEEMTCFYVDNEEHLFLVDDFIVTHNTRRQAELSCRTAVGEYYDTTKCKWVQTGIHEPALFISIELELPEVQTMWMSCISGVPEHHILDGRYDVGEEDRVRKAAQLMKNSQLYFVRISDYNMDDIENIIKKYYQMYGVQYFFYDYLASSIRILAEGANKTRISGLREDQILLMFITRLKELCIRLNIFIWTATQLSSDWKSAKEADQQLLRGAKAISDKADNGAILLPVREADKPIIAAHIAKGFELEPTHVIHIYKVRRGRFNNIRIYIHFDRATCRTTDCFVTNNEGVIVDVNDTNVELILDQTVDTTKPEIETLIDNTLDKQEDVLVETKAFDGFNF